MVHQSLVTRPAVPSTTVPPESHPTPDVLDVFGSKDNVVRAHFQRVLSLSAPAMIAIFVVYATLADMALALMLEALPFYSIADDAAAKAIDPRAMIADKGFGVTFIAAIFLAPLLETLMNQWFPIWLAMKMTHRPRCCGLVFDCPLWRHSSASRGVRVCRDPGGWIFPGRCISACASIQPQARVLDDRSDSRWYKQHRADGGRDPHPPGGTMAVKIPDLSVFQAEKDIDIIPQLSMFCQVHLQPPKVSPGLPMKPSGMSWMPSCVEKREPGDR